MSDKQKKTVTAKGYHHHHHLNCRKAINECSFRCCCCLVG